MNKFSTYTHSLFSPIRPLSTRPIYALPAHTKIDTQVELYCRCRKSLCALIVGRGLERDGGRE